MRRRGLLSSVAGAIAFGVFLSVFGYPWPLAVLASTAIGAFVYSAQSTWERLRDIYSRPAEAEPLLATHETQPKKIEDR